MKEHRIKLLDARYQIFKIDTHLSGILNRVCTRGHQKNELVNFWKNNPISWVHSRVDLFDKSIYESRRIEGLYLEFGVNMGGTINQISEMTPDKTIYGFDSFKGFPEDYADAVRKGSYACDVPEVNSNVEIVVGLFQDTLEGFLEEKKQNIAFLHIDCDLYSATKYVLDTSAKWIVAGTVIQFDELFEQIYEEGYLWWYTHELDAWNEFVKKYSVKFKWLGTQSTCCSVKIEEIKNES